MSFLWLLSASWGKGRGWVTGGLARIWCPCLGSSLSIWRAGALSPQTPFIPPELEILDKFWPSAHKKYTHWQHARCILFFLFLWCCECRLSILKTTFSFFQTEMNFSRTATYYVHLARYVWRKFKQWLISPRWSTQTHKHTHTLCIFSDTGRPDTMNSCETFWTWNSTEGKQLWLSVL